LIPDLRTAYNFEGVDMDMIDGMLSLTPEKRIAQHRPRRFCPSHQSAT
jgi:hypothetical protein